MHISTRAAMASILAVLGLGEAQSLRAASALDAVVACTGENDDSKRLACYDNALGRIRPANATGKNAAPVTSIAPTAAVAPGAATPAPAAAPAPTHAPAARLIPSTPDISASITNLSRRADGRYVITLSNGQVWLEVETKERFQADTGDAVTVRSGALGSHFLRTPQGSDVRVNLQQ